MCFVVVCFGICIVFFGCPEMYGRTLINFLLIRNQDRNRRTEKPGERGSRGEEKKRGDISEMLSIAFTEYAWLISILHVELVD